MQHLFSGWGEVVSRVKAARHVLLLSDYDGTLTPIVDRPELAHIPKETQRLLQALTQQPGVTVGIISGRALSDLKERVGIRGIVYAGNHGLEIEGPGVRFIEPLAEEIRPVLRLIHRLLTQALGAFKGVLVEDKGLTLSVHYRLLEGDRGEGVRGVVERAVAEVPSPSKVRITSGKKVYEVRPAVAWDKGKAVALLLERYQRGKGQVLPLFLGDDLTDEDGFKVVEQRSGISIYVGEEGGHSAARYSLRSPAEVEAFLARLVELAQGGTP